MLRYEGEKRVRKFDGRERREKEDDLRYTHGYIFG